VEVEVILGVALPVIVLAALAVLVPRLMERAVPESLGGLILNGVGSALVLSVLSAGYFAAAYAMRSSALLDLAGIAPGRTAAHFLRLGLMSGIVWAPVMVLAVASAPKRWKEAVW
jgi:hypothetical protein